MHEIRWCGTQNVVYEDDMDVACGVRVSPHVINIQTLNSMVWVRERTITAKRLPVVSEVIANYVINIQLFKYKQICEYLYASQ
jgi:hypothetical protein